jgi:hypothetical protein
METIGKRRYHRYKSLGLCFLCGKKAIPGKVLCEKCKEKMLTYSKKRKGTEARKMTCKKYYQSHKAQHQNYYMKKTYGITIDDYMNMFKNQQGKCAICGDEPTILNRHFHIDHDKTTGKIRGLLCHNCNVGIGNLRHNIEFLKKAIKYLRKHSEINNDTKEETDPQLNLNIIKGGE